MNLLHVIWFADFVSSLLTSPCGRQRERRCWGEDGAAPSALLLFRCYHQVVFLFLVSTPSDSLSLVLWRRFSVGVSALCQMKSLVHLSPFWFFFFSIVHQWVWSSPETVWAKVGFWFSPEQSCSSVSAELVWLFMSQQVTASLPDLTLTGMVWINRSTIVHFRTPILVYLCIYFFIIN